MLDAWVEKEPACPCCGETDGGTLRSWRGEHRLTVRGQRSAYIRRVLAGAPVEALDEALARESAALGIALDEMWADEWEDDSQ